MSRQSPTHSTIRALFARSGNVCAYRGCKHKIVEDDNLYVGEICHIEAAEPRGPRYNPNSVEEECRSYNNLILLCHAHHRRIDSNVKTYTVTRLCQMKAEHESMVSDNSFEVDASIVSQVEREMESYWSTLIRLQEAHSVPDLAVELKPGRSGTRVFKDLRAKIKDVEALLEYYRESDERAPEELKTFLQTLGYDLTLLELVPYYENPFENRNWERHNLGSPNVLLDLRTLQLYAELLYLTEYAKHHTGDTVAKARREAVMNELSNIAASELYDD